MCFVEGCRWWIERNGRFCVCLYPFIFARDVILIQPTSKFFVQTHAKTANKTKIYTIHQFSVYPSIVYFLTTCFHLTGTSYLLSCVCRLLHETFPFFGTMTLFDSSSPKYISFILKRFKQSIIVHCCCVSSFFNLGPTAHKREMMSVKLYDDICTTKSNLLGLTSANNIFFYQFPFFYYMGHSLSRFCCNFRRMFSFWALEHHYIILNVYTGSGMYEILCKQDNHVLATKHTHTLLNFIIFKLMEKDIYSNFQLLSWCWLLCKHYGTDGHRQSLRKDETQTQHT